MTIQLSDLSHISAITGDAGEAARFLESVFKAAVLNRSSTSYDELGPAQSVHAGVGDVMLEFLQPAADETPLARQLAEHGPLVHSLSFFVENLGACLAEMAKEDVRVIGRSTVAVATGAGTAPASTCLLDTMDRVGFNLELIEGSPGSTRIDGSFATEPQDVLWGSLSPLLHVEIAVEDLVGPYEFLRRVFGSKKIETQFSEFLCGTGRLDIVHVNLSNVVLQFCRPKTLDTSWQTLVSRRGRAVHNLTWLVRDMSVVVSALEQQGVHDLRTFMLDFGKLVGYDKVPINLNPQRIVDLMPKLGFHMELLETFASNMDDFIFHPLSDWTNRPCA